jgi:hypothetical protein
MQEGSRITRGFPWPDGGQPRRWSACAAALLLSGCAHPSTSGVPVTLARPSTSSATTDVTLMDRETRGRTTSLADLRISESTTGIVPAAPDGPLELPVYPVRALAAGARLVTVTAVISVDRDGRVTSVGPSSRGYTTPTPYDGDFRRAIEAAVMKWQFRPAWAVPMEPGKDGVPVLGEPEPTSSTVDAVFTFSSTGVVTTGVAP